MKLPFGIEISRNRPEHKGQVTFNGESSIGLLQNVGKRIAPSNLWQVYRMNADVYSCIREWRQSVGAGGYRFMSSKDHEEKLDDRVQADINRIFRNTGSMKKFASKTVRDWGICGNAYWEIVRNADGGFWGLKRLDPRTMYVFANEYGTVLKYVQQVAGMKSHTTFEPDEILHLIFDDDPDNEMFGMSPLETALWEARTDIAAAQSNYHFFENDAVPATMYVTEQGITEDAQKAVMEMIKESFSGAKNRNKSAILSGIKEIKQISMSQKDMEFVVGRKFNTDKVCSVYGVPKFVIGYTETVNYSSGSKLLEKFYEGTIKPLEDLLSTLINEQLLPKLGIEAHFEFIPQNFGEESEITRMALDELRAGALTLRQYKLKTGQDITPEDEEEILIDRHIIHSGASAVLMEDVGVDPIIDPNDPQTAENMINALKQYEELHRGTTKD